MSRCFPFPPPGYERKIRSDDVDLLKKAHMGCLAFCSVSWIMLRAGLYIKVLICLEDRVNKHKEKKDKERREDKEKREKDRSDGKQRNKKDRKEKHREKKEKDRDKDKDKSSASDENRLAGQTKLHNGGDKTSDERKFPGQSKHVVGDKALDGRRLQEKSEGNGGETCTQKGKERDVDKYSISGENKFSGQFSGYNGQKLIQNNSNLSHYPKDSKFAQQLGKRARDEDQNQFFEKFPGTDAKKDKGMVRLVAKTSCSWVEGKEKNKTVDDRKLDGQGIKDEARFTGSAQSLSATFQARIDGMLRPLEKDIEKKMKGKDKTKQKETNDKNEDQCKDKEKKGKEKDKVRDKEKKKEEKEKEKRERKKKEPDKLKESNMSNIVGNHTVKASHLSKESSNSAVEVNIKKRKDSDTNGFLHANDVKPNKLPRPTSLPQSAENGRMLGTCENPTAAIQVKQEAVNMDKKDNKGHKINGLIEAQAPSISSTTHPLSISLTKSLTNPSHSTAQTDEIAEVSRKQPHPDSKYLPDVLTVPKMEHWSDFEDQEWLFQSTYSQTKKPQVEVSVVNEKREVWSEALQIEAADVYALPYVIPY
ncbi:PREDICTED: DNA ligase 1-like isoform X1 [Populus euphratica]|uniref:DNA ligase 1-like isoform X1 n=1 Tax=Populus euphratica TaxID=75702 RepID=A0AAJ6Y4K5_POPEU|nr:PREDICTED: DNA ligase 1-like isoform X1 [Populus euphratica]